MSPWREQALKKILGAEFADNTLLSPVKVDEIIQKRCAEFIHGVKAGKNR